MAQVNEQSAAVSRMAGDWAVIEALMGGTAVMRAAKTTYLPKQPREEQADYDYRLKVATLFPAYERTVNVMAGKPFSKQITVSEGVPDAIKQLLSDIDGKGRSLHVFAAEAFTELMAYGYGGILVDYTKTDGQAKTRADEIKMGARPYWTLYRHDQILELRYDDKGQKLLRVRLKEWVEVDDGEFGRKQIEQVRVLTPGHWAVHRADDKGVWGVHEEGDNKKVMHITFAPLIAGKLNPEEGRAPLRNLAYLNVKHWQLQSDLDDSLRYAIKPIITITGLTDTNTQITLQAGGIMKLPTGASLDVKQGQSEAITVGRTEIAALEQQMIQTGAELLVATPGQRTATEASNDAEANKSQLQRLAEDFEDALDLALQFTADWLGAGDGGTVSLYSDYASTSLSDASAQLVMQLGQLGWITKETVLREMQRRSTLSADLVPADEVGLAAEQGSVGIGGD